MSLATVPVGAALAESRGPRHSPAERQSIGPVGRLRRPVLVLTPPLEVRLHERVEVAVEHGLNVAGLVAGAFVLDELVRRQRVRTDLTSERDIALLTRQPLELGALLLALTLRQTCGKNLHRFGAVLKLRALVLARHDDARRQVGDAHR